MECIFNHRVRIDLFLRSWAKSEFERLITYYHVLIIEIFQNMRFKKMRHAIVVGFLKIGSFKYDLSSNAARNSNRVGNYEMHFMLALPFDPFICTCMYLYVFHLISYCIPISGEFQRFFFTTSAAILYTSVIFRRSKYFPEPNASVAFFGSQSDERGANQQAMPHHYGLRACTRDKFSKAYKMKGRRIIHLCKYI